MLGSFTMRSVGHPDRAGVEYRSATSHDSQPSIIPPVEGCGISGGTMMALTIHDALTKAETALHDVLDELRRTFGADVTTAKAQASDILATVKTDAGLVADQAAADTMADVKQAADNALPRSVR